MNEMNKFPITHNTSQKAHGEWHTSAYGEVFLWRHFLYGERERYLKSQ